MPEVVHGSETAGFPSCTRAAVWQHAAIVHLSGGVSPKCDTFRGQGCTSRGAMPGDRARVGLGRLGPIIPNGTATGSMVPPGVCGTLPGGFSLTKHTVSSHHLSRCWQVYH